MTDQPQLPISPAGSGRSWSTGGHAEDEIRGASIGARTLLEDSPICTKIIDLEGRLVFMSHAGVSRLQIPDVEALYGQTYPAELYPEWIRKPMVEHLNRALVGEVSSVECPLLDANGEEVWYHTTFLPVKDEAGELQYILATSAEITKRILAEEALRRIQKLDSIGVLAGGIAHDFNNLLTGLTANLSLAEQKRGCPEDIRALLAESLDVCESAKNLTSQLLTFAVGGEPVVETLALASVAQAVGELTSRASNATCVFDFADDLAPVRVDRNQLNQVVQNLVLNAAQAMPGGGEINIGAKNVSLEANELPLLPGGEYVKLHVHDHGTGIELEHLARIFDPFFSTKDSGRGLGLATCHSIISKHGGFIDFETTENEGTTFFVYLPAGNREDLSAKEPASGPSKSRRRVLVMDDEPGVLKVVGRLVESLGYECVCTENGALALEAWGEAEKSGDGFSVAIMDLVVPGGLGGKEANAMLKELYPGAKSIVSSGYSNDAVMSRHADFGFDGVLPKPFTRDQLAKALGQLVETA